MEEWSTQRKRVAQAVVLTIAHQWMLDGSKMHANLMGTSRFELGLHQGDQRFRCSRHYFVRSFCVFPAHRHCHLGSKSFASANGAIDRALVGLHVTPNERNVAPLDVASF